MTLTQNILFLYMTLLLKIQNFILILYMTFIIIIRGPIQTDSNNVITKFEKFKGNITFQWKIKENNLVFWKVLFEIIKR